MVELPQTSVFHLLCHVNCLGTFSPCNFPVSILPHGSLYKKDSFFRARLQTIIMAPQVAMQALTQLRKGPWLEEEDERLIAVVSALGEKRWDALAKASGLRRSGKSCRLRWMNYLRPNLKHGHITAEEAHLIVELHKQWGNRWSRIARRLPGRTDNEIKNYWRSHLRKKALTLEQEYLSGSLNDDGQQNSSVSMHEVVSPCSSNEEWNSGKGNNLGNLAESSEAYDLSGFELSCSSPYQTRLTDWMSNWSIEEQNEPEQNANCYESDHLSYCPPEWITGYSDSDASIWDGSLSIWDMY